MSKNSYSEDRLRLYGIYRGIVSANADPLGKHRVRVTVPQIFGKAQTNWAEACFPITSTTNHTNHVATLGSGSAGDPAHTHSVSVNLSHSTHATKPNIGDHVWVMFEGGDPDFPVWMGVRP